MYKVNGEISTDKIKWAIIDEIDEADQILWVTDEDGETFSVSFEQVNSYDPPYPLYEVRNVPN